MVQFNKYIALEKLMNTEQKIAEENNMELMFRNFL